MLLNIAPLSKAELKLLLSIFKISNRDENSPPEELQAAETAARDYIRNPRGHVRLVSRHTWGDSTNMGESVLREIWAQACDLCINSIVSVRNEIEVYCPLPTLSLPSRSPMILVTSRKEFVEWMFARAVANGQWLRFVKCRSCNKIALRRRARKENHYCTTAHQKVENLKQMMMMKHPEEFRAWLYKQPESKVPRLKNMLLAALESGWRPSQKGPRVRPLYDVLTLVDVPANCPTCGEKGDKGQKHPLTFAKHLKHIAGNFDDVWYCRTCSQVIRKR